MHQYHLFISGLVQGIGFRQFIKTKAHAFAITGWVRNTADGRVEALLQGQQGALNKLINFCRQGPMLAKVKKLSVSQESVKEVFTDFSIRSD